VELEHLKIKTRLTNEKFAIVKGEVELQVVEKTKAVGCQRKPI
jgi:hypothetical protein